MDFDYFYGRGADQFAFYQIPKILITDEKFAGITMESKILYSLMLDRASLSVKNGWLDEDGKVFIYYKLDRIMADMHCANQKATKMLKELEDKAGLIERQKQGQGKPTKIYVKDFATGLHDYGPDRRIIQTHENHDSETNENHESRNVIITGPDSWKSCTNNTNYNNKSILNAVIVGELKLIQCVVLGTLFKTLFESWILQQQMIDNSGDRELVEQLEDRMDDLREDRQDILAEAAERTDLQTRMNDMIAFLEEMPVAVTEYSEVLARRLVDRITIFDEKIVVELKSGLQMEVEE